MKLRTAREILLASCLLTIVAILACSLTKTAWMGYLGIAFAVVGTAVWIIFGRCRNCGYFLGRTGDRYCPHCGTKIDWES